MATAKRAKLDSKTAEVQAFIDATNAEYERVHCDFEKQFWCTKDAGQKPFSYQAGVGGVIKGWDQGCLGMAVGETRKLTIPGHEGYGGGGFPACKFQNNWRIILWRQLPSAWLLRCCRHRQQLRATFASLPHSGA